MSDYIPSTDPEKVLWLLALTDWLETNGAAHGFTPVEITDFQTEVGAAQTALNTHIAAQDAARAATIAKNEAIGTAIATGRDYAQKLQHDLSMTDADRAAAGITVPDPDKTPAAPQSVAEMEPPLLLLDFHIRHQVSIHWGPNPGNEHENGKPRGVLGCEIQYARGGIPADESGWVPLGLDTDSPLLHHIDPGNPGTGTGMPENSDSPARVPPLGQSPFSTTYAYRARYVDKKLNYGNFGDPVECTVSV